MKLNLVGKLTLVLAAYFLVLTNNLNSVGFNLNTEILPENLLGISIYNWVGGFTSSIHDEAGVNISYGLFPKTEIQFGILNLSLYQNFGYLYSFLMIRYDLSENNIGALSIIYYPGNIFGLEPQYHLVSKIANFVLEFNIKATFKSSDFTKPVFTSYIATVYNFGNLSLYLEIDPIYDLGTGFKLDLIPGFAYTFSDYSQICIGISLGDADLLNNGFSPAIAVYYWQGFAFK